MSRERQHRKQDEIRKTILDASRDVISKEGLSGLSIRKITKAIDYSPAIIYHYFKDKDEIVKALVKEGYEKIISSIGLVERNNEEPEKEIQQAFTQYIKAAQTFPEEYKAFMLNDDASVLDKTVLLQKGISQTSQTLQLLCDNIQRGISQGRYAPCDPELTAQIFWTSTFGLIIKLIIEKELPQGQIDRLINRHFSLLFDGIIRKEEIKK
ncbi:TetR/AcrR family transcriptional regulator [Desulfosporosinus sp. SB140]|uniref:TetR/AcrR family transcriptional regulator n=1 Tax=Desulfosporosinus paludis TaxID=3115649 RepID=UPI00388E9DC0